MCAVEMTVETDGLGNRMYMFRRGGSSVFLDDVELALRCKAHGLDPASEGFAEDMGRLLFPDAGSWNPYINDRPFMPNIGDVDMDAVLAAMRKMGVVYD